MIFLFSNSEFNMSLDQPLLTIDYAFSSQSKTCALKYLQFYLLRTNSALLEYCFEIPYHVLSTHDFPYILLSIVLCSLLLSSSLAHSPFELVHLFCSLISQSPEGFILVLFFLILFSGLMIFIILKRRISLFFLPFLSVWSFENLFLLSKSYLTLSLYPIFLFLFQFFKFFKVFTLCLTSPVFSLCHLC